MSIATVAFQSLPQAYPIWGVNTVNETRRTRLEMLVKKYGSLAALNAQLELSKTDSTLSQVRNQSTHSKSGAPRTMGDPLARKIEEKCDLPRGWMDTPPTYAELHGENDQRAKVMLLMEKLPDDQLAIAARLLDALVEPPQKNGTTGN